MSQTRDDSCGCPPLPHPQPPNIPAGLPTLAKRQLSGFPEYRSSMLMAIPRYREFTDWRARSEGDLGVMLLEAWSVVLDITAFYDARIAERSYLQTAPDQATARNLVKLIGHQPRPAIAARVELAVQADGADPVALPKATGFRSGPFDGEAPQVFELVNSHQIWPQRNHWQLAPVREADFDGTLRFLPRQAPSAGATLVIWSTTKHAAAVRVASVEPDLAPDGVTYQKVTLAMESDPGLSEIEAKNVSRASLKVAILRVPMSEISASNSKTDRSEVVLDAVYNQVKPGHRGAIEISGELHAVKISKVERVLRDIEGSGDPAAQQVLTKVTFSPSLKWGVNDGFTLHASPFPIGEPSRIANTKIQLSDLQGSGKLESPVELGDAPGGGSIIARGKSVQGVKLDGTVIEDGDGQAHFAPETSSADFEQLGTPVKLHGNIVEAVRGESVSDEALGSGNTAVPYQSFTLKKKPLTWVEDASLPGGCRPELTVSVSGLEWVRVDTFFGTRPEQQIYTVTLEADGGSRINFGDGKRGARLPSGVANIRADYRYGAGAAKPPSGSIQSIAKPTKGLLSVIGPVPAHGGADAETEDELRQSAPATALTLGRAVSLADFVAMARAFSGIINAASAWAWDRRRQRASAKLWIIADSGDPSADLAKFLSARAAPDLLVAVELAGSATLSTLAITLSYTDGYDPLQVREAVDRVLFDKMTGFLAPRVQTIGGTLFRSALTHRLHQVAGVASVPTIQLDGIAMPHAVAAGQGNWFDLESGTTVI